MGTFVNIFSKQLVSILNAGDGESVFKPKHLKVEIIIVISENEIDKKVKYDRKNY